MRVKINDAGELVINVDDLLQHVTDTQRTLAVQSLSCRDDIIRHVMDQVFTGYTEDHYWGGHSSTRYDPYTPLDVFRRNISKCAGNIAKEEIERLELALKEKCDELSECKSKLSAY